MCLPPPCVCPLRGPTVCMSPPCLHSTVCTLHPVYNAPHHVYISLHVYSFTCMYPPCISPPYVCSFKCTSHVCICPLRVYVPPCACSFMCMSPPCRCPHDVYTPWFIRFTMCPLHLTYISCICLHRVQCTLHRVQNTLPCIPQRVDSAAYFTVCNTPPGVRLADSMPKVYPRN